MLLAIDIGNTNIKIGLFDGEKHLVTWSISTRVHRTPDEYGIVLLNFLHTVKLQKSNVSRGAISSVVPPLVTTFTEMFQKYFDIQPLVIGPGIKTGVRIRTDDPRAVGADLISNAAAAMSLYKPPIIVVGMGTATAIVTISREGDYLGGALAPGLGIAAEALYTRTAALPRVGLARPKKAIGSNTLEAMQSGLIFGYAGLINGLVARMEQELGEKATVVATGGYAPIISAETSCIEHVNTDLTLIGIRIIHGLNRD